MKLSMKLVKKYSKVKNMKKKLEKLHMLHQDYLINKNDLKQNYH